MSAHDLDAAADSARSLRDAERSAAQTSDTDRPLRICEPFVPTWDDIRYDAALDAGYDHPRRR